MENVALTGDKRTALTPLEQIGVGNARWWNERPMAYDWRRRNPFQCGSSEWFEWMDAKIVAAHRLFATDIRPFDRIMPLDWLSGRRVLEIGCGMGLHSEVMARMGATVTAIDVTPAAVEMTRRRFSVKGLQADIRVCDGEQLPFSDQTFDFVWSWGVIHHSGRTGRVVRQIARVLRPSGECRVMVYNRAGMSARMCVAVNHVLKLGFLKRSLDETLFRSTDGFSARYYVNEQFEDLFRSFFNDVTSVICGQDADVLPLPHQLRLPLMRLIPTAYQRRAQARRGGFIFLTARSPE